MTCVYSEVIHEYYELLRRRHALKYAYNNVKTDLKSVRIIKNANASCDLEALRPFRPTIVLLRRCFGTYIGIDVTFASTLYKPLRIYFTIRALSVPYFAGPRTVHDTHATYTARREPRLDDVGGGCVTYTHTRGGVRGVPPGFGHGRHRPSPSSRTGQARRRRRLSPASLRARIPSSWTHTGRSSCIEFTSRP